VLRAIMDISARAFSLPDRPRWAIWVIRVRRRGEDRPPFRFIPSRTSPEIRKELTPCVGKDSASVEGPEVLLSREPPNRWRSCCTSW
jgi:hypothetical protein